MDARQAYDLKLDDLQDAYRSRRDRVLQRLEAVGSPDELTREELPDFLVELHQLAGTAGYFCQGALGHAAAHLEQDLASVDIDRAFAVLRARASTVLKIASQP